ncbi:transposable element Tcb1 transposase [Trichonephila clavipes]|nr:transposable element Tcb1 transposase [Trichonephila clavipes]
MRGDILERFEGRKITHVCRVFDIAHSVVHGCADNLKLLECVVDGLGGRVKNTTPAEDRYIVLSAKGTGAPQTQRVANQFLAASGKQISKNCCQTFEGRRTIRTQPVVCVPLTRQHHTAAVLQWCREHLPTEQDWACVLFSYECRFSLSSDCRRQLIWRESGTASRKYPGKGPISDMQYHGVGRHHDQWPHAPTCGCEWDYDGPTIH